MPRHGVGGGGRVAPAHRNDDLRVQAVHALELGAAEAAAQAGIHRGGEGGAAGLDEHDVERVVGRFGERAVEFEVERDERLGLAAASLAIAAESAVSRAVAARPPRVAAWAAMSISSPRLTSSTCRASASPVMMACSKTWRSTCEPSPLTRGARPGAVAIVPSASRVRDASRTTGREMPSAFAISVSPGRRSPGFSPFLAM